MDEVVPGIYHYTRFHERIRQPVHSYFHAPSRTLIDPMAPEDDLAWFRDGREPERIVLTNRHHYRGSEAFVEEFGCPVLCPRPGMHEHEGHPEVRPYDWDVELAEGVRSREVGAICPDDGALLLATDSSPALALADSLIDLGGRLSFVPDFLMDEPDVVKRGLLASLERLAEEDFDALLLAHGEPLASGGREALREFVEAGGRSEPIPGIDG